MYFLTVESSAKATLVTILSASPVASLAIVFIVVGAMMKVSHHLPSSI